MNDDVEIADGVEFDELLQLALANRPPLRADRAVARREGSG